MNHDFLLKALLTIAVCLTLGSNANEPKNVSSILTADKVNWGYLNPLRGDKSPGAAELWGDRTKNVPTGMLVKFKKGFSSPPHIHNISYRGVVIKGQVHNDDPTAEKLWLPTGSFWTQPAGENHITAANDVENIIFLEIDTGPYLVKPSDQQFDNGEKPINLHNSNMVWLSNNDLENIHSNKVKVTHLWGSPKNGEPGGELIKLQKGFIGSITTNAKEFRVVIINGNLLYNSTETEETVTLLPGSYFNSTAKFKHELTASEETFLYIRTIGKYQIDGN